MRWVNEQIAIGDASDAVGVTALQASGISGVLSLDWFPMSAPTPALDWRKHPLIDGPGNPPTALEAALADLQGLVADCPRVLVHCREGVSRSPFVVACHLASASGRPLPETIDEVRERIGWLSINPALLVLWSALEIEAGGRGGMQERASDAR